jgi:hypothetical protein
MDFDLKYLNKAHLRIIISVLSGLLLFNTTNVLACDKAQLVDYDYQIKELLVDGYSTFGRLWLFDNKESCVDSLKYGACLRIKPLGDVAEITLA